MNGENYGEISVTLRRGDRLAQNGGEGEKHHSNSQGRCATSVGMCSMREAWHRPGQRRRCFWAAELPLKKWWVGAAVFMTVCSVDGNCGQLTFDLMECDIEPIVVPADWNGEKDLQDIEDIFGMELEESKLPPHDFMLLSLSDAQEHSSMVVENAVSFLLGQLPARMIQRVPANLSGPRLVLLRKLVACVPPDKHHEGYVAAIESSAEGIRYYQSQLDDLLPPLVVNEAPPWLFVLRCLRDRIVLAADSLDDDMHFTYSKYPYMG